MKILLDTHVFLWFISGDRRLSEKLRDAVRNLDNEVYLSVVSVWESIVKYQIGKLPFPESPEIYLPRQRILHKISSLSLDEASLTQLIQLPGIHRDPFDRMLICQALEKELKIATVDEDIRKYPVDTI